MTRALDWAVMMILHNMVTSQIIFEPVLTVKSCNDRKLVVTVANSTYGGIIYIQGQGAACLQIIAEEADTYEFDFASCNVIWDKKFNLVIQKNPLYQRAGDKVIPVTCLVNTDDITVSASTNVHDSDEDGLQEILRPLASMRIYRDGSDVTGNDVTLDDLLFMTVDLDEAFQRDFDIQARTCFAATIPIIEDNCALDSGLFPSFDDSIQGKLAAGFAAFRPTVLSGEEVTMVFSCTLTACKGKCLETLCGHHQSNRSKRAIAELTSDPPDTEAALQTPDNSTTIRKLNVGTVIRIVTEERARPVEKGTTCMSRLPFLITMGIFSGFSVISLLASFIIDLKIKHCTRMETKLLDIQSTPTSPASKDTDQFPFPDENEEIEKPKSLQEIVTDGTQKVVSIVDDSVSKAIDALYGMTKSEEYCDNILDSKVPVRDDYIASYALPISS